MSDTPSGYVTIRVEDLENKLERFFARRKEHINKLYAAWIERETKEVTTTKTRKRYWLFGPEIKITHTRSNMPHYTAVEVWRDGLDGRWGRPKLQASDIAGGWILQEARNLQTIINQTVLDSNGIKVIMVNVDVLAKIERYINEKDFDIKGDLKSIYFI